MHVHARNEPGVSNIYYPSRSSSTHWNLPLAVPFPRFVHQSLFTFVHLIDDYYFWICDAASGNRYIRSAQARSGRDFFSHGHWMRRSHQARIEAKSSLRSERESATERENLIS